LLQVDKRTVLWASVGAFLGSGIWGAFWIPLRYIHGLGLSGPWTLFFLGAIATVVLCPLLVLRWRIWRPQLKLILFAGLLTSIPFVCYNLALIYTTVLKATFLFYLTPVWSSILAYVVLREAIHGKRLLAIGLGLIGLLVILISEDSWLPIPQNFGDWVALASGIGWAGAAVLLRKEGQLAPIDTTLTSNLCSAIVILPLAVFFFPVSFELMASLEWSKLGPALAFMSLALAAPSFYVIIWAAQRISPGRIGILMMSEVIVAVITAGWLLDEPFGPKEWIGGGLIVIAGMIEVLDSSE
jgi:drug/metabolite transporter (DMT)-like permease